MKSSDILRLVAWFIALLAVVALVSPPDQDKYEPFPVEEITPLN